MTYTQNQVAQTELARSKAKRELDLRELEYEEAKRANRASEALKHEANAVSREAALLAKEGRTESAAINAKASKYSTDVKAATDQQKLAQDAQKILNDFSIAKEANAIKRITANAQQRLTDAQISKINNELVNMRKQLSLERDRLLEQKKLWESQAKLNNTNARLRPIEVTIDGVNKALSRTNDFMNTGLTNRRDIMNFINEQEKRANELNNTLVDWYDTLGRQAAREENSNG